MGALILWAKRHVGSEPLEVIKVPEAKEWTAANLAAGLKQVRYDWVFGTEYQGELVGLPIRGDDPSKKYIPMFACAHLRPLCA